MVMMPEKKDFEFGYDQHGPEARVTVRVRDRAGRL
jgi:hypothetical protein